MALTQQQISQTIKDMLAASPTDAFNFNRADIVAAINAVDAWATANSASFNTALPVPFRPNATVAEKNQILAYVCLRRAGL